jgi:alpha-1,2-mannosyltransferase
MNHRYQSIGIAVVLCIIYTILFYFILSNHQKLDFSAFYSAPYALMQGKNPYRDLFTNYLIVNKALPANLNPPIVLWCLTPLVRFTYSTAVLIWSIFSVLLGLFSFAIMVRYAFSAEILQKYRVTLYLIYFAFFPTLMNVATLQFGTVLFFFIIVGYHFYLNNRDYSAGILWGSIIAMKIFPALLFFYVLKQGRYKVFCMMFITLLIAWLIPLLIYGPAIYNYYFSMLSHVLWYGDGWNASIYGFIFRLFIDPHNPYNLNLIEALYAFLFFILLLWYLKNLGPSKQKQVNHQPFCLTLAMMLLMSPLGWVYYFPMLIFPLILTWYIALEDECFSIKTMLLWFLSFFLINFPLDYVKTQRMPHDELIRISLFSTYFYGLLLLIFLLGKRKEIYGNNGIWLGGAKNHYLPTLIIILIFGLSVPFVSFVMRLFRFF